MAVKIKVINFQSIAKAELAVEGFTAVTGPNNSGKTALLRAVQGAFTNAPGKSFIRKGQEKTAVAVKFEDGKSVLWAKGTKMKPTYRINGGEAINPGRQIPEELADLGVNPIRLGDRELWPSIAQQMVGQVFLLDLPGSALAEAVADVKRVGKLNKSLRLCESDRRSKGATLKVRKADVAKAELDLSAYEGLDSVENQLEQLEQQRQAVLKLQRKLEFAKGLKARLDAATAEVSSLQKVEGVEVPDLDLLIKVQASLSTAEPLRERLSVAQKQVKALTPVEVVEIPATDLSTPVAELREAVVLRKRYLPLKGEVDRLSAGSLPSLEEDAAQKAKRLVAGLKKVSTLKADREQILQQVSDLESQIASGSEEVERLIHETHDLLGSLKECPTCEQHWSPA